MIGGVQGVLSKLPSSGVSIFEVMSGLARQHQAVNLSQGFPDFGCAPGNYHPVEFNRLLIQAKDAKYGAETPGAIEFTREGQEAEHERIGRQDRRVAPDQDCATGSHTVRGTLPLSPNRNAGPACSAVMGRLWSIPLVYKPRAKCSMNSQKGEGGDGQALLL